MEMNYLYEYYHGCTCCICIVAVYMENGLQCIAGRELASPKKISEIYVNKTGETNKDI